jgi:hypothetical protein
MLFNSEINVHERDLLSHAYPGFIFLYRKLSQHLHHDTSQSQSDRERLRDVPVR